MKWRMREVKDRMLLVALLTAALLAGPAVADDEAASTGTPIDFEPVGLGTSRAALNERFGEHLRVVEVVVPRSALEQVVESAESVEEEPDAGPFVEQERLGRSIAGSEIQSAEYDLFQGRVYRTRWQLGAHFERPFMSVLVTQLAERLGEPDYDQTIEAKLGSGKSDLRRTGWRRVDRVFEVRQLHPFTGGPLFVSLSDIQAMDRIVAARGVVLPQPEATGAWWSRPQREMSLPTSKERERLLHAIEAILAKIEFPKDPPRNQQ